MLCNALLITLQTDGLMEVRKARYHARLRPEIISGRAQKMAKARAGGERSIACQSARTSSLTSLNVPLQRCQVAADLIEKPVRGEEKVDERGITADGGEGASVDEDSPKSRDRDLF